MGNELTLKKLKNTTFPNLYLRYMTGDDLDSTNIEILLSVAVLLINTKDISLQHLGYRIVVDYCNNSSDYRPLYELAINYGLFPVGKFIETHYMGDSDRNFFSEWNAASAEQYRSTSAEKSIYHTEQQRDLYEFFRSTNDETVSVIAPTSYGKSELILETVKQFSEQRICIVTSTKALLMQMKQRIVSENIVPKKKIIVHPEMYRANMQSFVAVLTQERLHRFLKKDDNLAFDCIVIDEAHELLENNTRSNILASTIIIAKKRNPDVVFKFLTPFLSDPDNLEPRFLEYSLKSFRVREYIKTEKYYVYDLREGTGKYYYDQFLNRFQKIESYRKLDCEEREVIANSAMKNIIYLNKPKDIETFALSLATMLPQIASADVDSACESIADYLQPQYNLIYCLKRGVVYHHGSVPDTIRLFVEDSYKRLPEIKYIVTSSTLLAGVNLPAERLFLLDNRKGHGNLKPDAFRNLTGRVCRFSDIFSSNTGDLRMLEPEIHIVFGKYFAKKARYKSFLESVAKADTILQDRVENILLKNTEVNSENQSELVNATELLENYEAGTIADYDQRYIQTEIGKSAIVNGIREVDIFRNEAEMQEVVEVYRRNGRIIDNTESLMTAIQAIFINHINDDGNDRILRIRNQEALDFYAMLFEWRMSGKLYSEMILLLNEYWKELLRKNPDAYVYTGRWGDVNMFYSHNKPYTYLRSKSYSQLINLAIVRIKEEQDFIDNDLIRFIEVLNDLKLMDEQFYSRVKYGTDDDKAICLLKNGLSRTLSALLLSRYMSLITIDIFDNTIQCDGRLVMEMQNNNENDILIYEAMNYI